ncbi:hypothetical protein TIFTF001_017691 [Ficus carica]|uniref:Uncharacterized protein n=1 Tax=Ficus carica TaxID=3494 RepID=A0AA88ACQ2_FICCA|nr:hypothetical protein TIFTF001_017691 [Ficus carica]
MLILDSGANAMWTDQFGRRSKSWVKVGKVGEGQVRVTHPGWRDKLTLTSEFVFPSWLQGGQIGPCTESDENANHSPRVH